MKKIVLTACIIMYSIISFSQDELTATKLTINKNVDGGELLKFNTDRPWVFKNIGTSQYSTLRLNTTSNGKNFEITNLDGTSKTAIFHVNNDLAGARAYFVPYGGRVGIGTTSPDDLLDVEGNLRITNGYLRVYTSSGTSGYINGLGNAKMSIGSENGTELVIDRSLNSIGIGTSDPKAKLHVNDGLLLIGNATYQEHSEQIRLGRNDNPDIRYHSISTYHSINASENYIQFNIHNGGSESPFTNQKTVFTINGIGNAALQGKFEAKEIKVLLAPTADFVFEEEYKLKKIDEVESFIKENKHLPDFPSGKEIEEDGINVGEMDAKLLQKIEELTLYTIEQQKEIEDLKNQNAKIENLEKQNKEILELLKTLQ